MIIPELKPFRLVGGTALGLLKGHRESVDIDLFTNQDYGTINFKKILEILRTTFPIVENPIEAFPQIAKLEIKQGLNLNIGYDIDNLVKTDILYWDVEFLAPPIVDEGVRLASILEIAAMKLDVISRKGRKKDFWDLVEILEEYQLSDLLNVYSQVYPYYDVNDVVDNICDFKQAELDPDPICLKSRNWETVKQRIIHEASSLNTKFSS